MPELPEVETIARMLRPELAGRTILAADLLWPRTLAVPSAGKFKKDIAGQEILAVARRGKLVHLRLSTFNLFVHLRMSGDLYIKEADALPEKHDRLALMLSPSEQAGAQKLVFNDARKFGRVWLVRDPQQVTGKLGPEPLEEAFTPQMLYESLQARRRQLKPLLLDQSFLAGMGNIYTDEALHIARLHPQAMSNSVEREQAGALWEAIRAVLQQGIRRNGASIDWAYRGGQFQNDFRVYGREGQTCPACGTAIQRIVVGQRGTHFCPACQPRE
ncbi:MAG: bifunctional DNA-formamidopyrimidine glycosylase/DNA-(apurinic or apyrimidinic site) lyase [Chloroflexota bacterium]